MNVGSDVHSKTFRNIFWIKFVVQQAKTPYQTVGIMNISTEKSKQMEK